MGLKATCPNDPTHKRFSTVIHVAEDAIVDGEGNFIETDKGGDVQMTHGPNKDNIWTCMSCGAEADVEEVS